MSSTNETSAKDITKEVSAVPKTSQAPSLPANVSIFSPSNPAASKALLDGRIFTRLTVSVQTEPSRLAAALRAKPEISETFCLAHQNAVLIFDGDEENADLTDTHHDHFRLVCLALKENNVSLDIAGCVFDTPNVLQAGFQLDELSRGSVMVIDLMGGEDDDSDSEPEDAMEMLMGGKPVSGLVGEGNGKDV